MQNSFLYHRRDRGPPQCASRQSREARDEDTPTEIAPLMGPMFALAGGDPFPQPVGVGTRVHGDNSGRVSYVDFPAADVEKFLSANHSEARRFSAVGLETEEYFLPKELAAKRPSRGGTGLISREGMQPDPE
jgi:hypothetical protein